MNNLLLELTSIITLLAVFVGGISLFIGNLIFMISYELAKKQFKLSREDKSSLQQIGLSISLIAGIVFLGGSILLYLLEWYYSASQMHKTSIFSTIGDILNKLSTNASDKGPVWWAKCHLNYAFQVANPFTLAGIARVCFKMFAIFKISVVVFGLGYMVSGFFQEKCKFALSNTNPNQNQQLGLRWMFVGLFVTTFALAFESTIDWVLALSGKHESHTIIASPSTTTNGILSFFASSSITAMILGSMVLLISNIIFVSNYLASSQQFKLSKTDSWNLQQGTLGISLVCGMVFLAALTILYLSGVICPSSIRAVWAINSLGSSSLFMGSLYIFHSVLRFIKVVFLGIGLITIIVGFAQENYAIALGSANPNSNQKLGLIFVLIAWAAGTSEITFKTAEHFLNKFKSAPSIMRPSIPQLKQPSLRGRYAARSH